MTIDVQELSDEELIKLYFAVDKEVWRRRQLCSKCGMHKKNEFDVHECGPDAASSFHVPTTPPEFERKWEEAWSTR